jgi:Ni/Co efflux regulator RcnB
VKKFLIAVLLAAVPIAVLGAQDPQSTPTTGSDASSSHHSRRHHKRSRNSHRKANHHRASKQHSQPQ